MSCRTFSSEDVSHGSADSQQVAFGNIEIREHAMILGKGPSVSGTGPSLEIEWEAQANMVVGIEEYESTRYNRRHKNQLIMPGEYRRNLLLESGFTMREISEMSTKPKNSSKVMKKLSKFLPSGKK